MRAARKQIHQDSQVPRREEPPVALDYGRLGGTRDEAQTATLREIVQVLDADSREVHDLCISEKFLACFDLSWDKSSRSLEAFKFQTVRKRFKGRVRDARRR